MYFMAFMPLNGVFYCYCPKKTIDWSGHYMVIFQAFQLNVYIVFVYISITANFAQQQQPKINTQLFAKRLSSFIQSSRNNEHFKDNES